MQKTFKKLIFVLTICLMFPLLTVSAYTPRQLSQYAKEISEAKKQTLEGAVQLTKQQISTVYNGVLGADAVWNNHTVQWLTVPSENTAIKTVVWSAGTTEDWKAQTVATTVADYEAKHPGYIVVGAVNGDFFHINTTHEPLNYHVQEGDVLRTNWNGDSNWGLIGFKSAKEHVIGLPSRSASMYLKKITNTDTEELGVIMGTNVAPSNDGIYVFTKNLNTTVDLAGYNVYKATNSLYREYSGGYFIKGKVDEVSSLTTLSSVPSGTFYIATKDELLAVDDQIKVEYNVTGVFTGVNDVIGYCYPCLDKGEVLFQNISTKVMDGYFTTLNPRTLVGFKEDGSIVLMVIDGRGTSANNLDGATLFQCGELLRLAGCVEGYNLDGGGSSTLMARINGELTLINDPSDARQSGQPWGTLRSIGNAVLLVMKDPKLTIDNPVGNTITVRKTGEVVDGTLQNVKVKIDNKEYDLTGDELVITGLDPNTEYTISYEYDIKNNDGSIEHGISETYTRTTEDYCFPVLDEFVEHRLEEGSVTFKYDIDAEEKDIKKVYVKYGDQEVLLEKLSGRVTIEDLDTTVENSFVLMAELKNGKIVELARLKYEANTIPAKEVENTPTPDPTPDKESGCKKEASLLMISLIGLGSLLALFKKKK